MTSSPRTRFRSPWSLGLLALVAHCSAQSTNKGGTGGEASDSPKKGGVGGGGGSPDITPGTGGNDSIPPETTKDASPDQDPSVPLLPSKVNSCTADEANAFQGAGDAAGMRWLYPYDQTVFPQGLPAPVLQWDQPGSVDAVYLHVKTKDFEYEKCFGKATLGRLETPADLWKAILHYAKGKGDPVALTVKVKQGDKVLGPIQESWIIAKAPLRATVYYNSYDSPLAGNNGAVMRVDPGATRPTPFLVEKGGTYPNGPCHGCHSVSTDGSTMVAAKHAYPSGPYSSSSYDLRKGGTGAPQSMAQFASDAAFGALTPDGTRVLTMHCPGASSYVAANHVVLGGSSSFSRNIPGLVASGATPSKLFDTHTGKEIPGSGVPTGARMPMFSHDGTKLAFDDVLDGHNIKVLDYNQQQDAFSNLTVIVPRVGDADTRPHVGWPSFTPDTKAVIYVHGGFEEFVSYYPGKSGFDGNDMVSETELFYVRLDSQEPSRKMFAAAGQRPDGTSYMPGADDLHKDYFPSVSPLVADGYYWLFFTSRRSYGNSLRLGAKNTLTKKIWVAAIDINSAPGKDPSHPAFYFQGQELAAGNTRAFASVAACKVDGQGCENGSDCCAGACTDGLCAAPKSCSKELEKCKSRNDCCDKADDATQCIGGYCQSLAPPH